MLRELESLRCCIHTTVYDVSAPSLPLGTNSVGSSACSVPSPLTTNRLPSTRVTYSTASPPSLASPRTRILYSRKILNGVTADSVLVSTLRHRAAYIVFCFLQK